MAGRFNVRQLSPVMSHVISQSKEKNEEDASKFSLNTPHSTKEYKFHKSKEEEKKLRTDLREHIIKTRTS